MSYVSMSKQMQMWLYNKSTLILVHKIEICLVLWNLSPNCMNEQGKMHNFSTLCWNKYGIFTENFDILNIVSPSTSDKVSISCHPIRYFRYSRYRYRALIIYILDFYIVVWPYFSIVTNVAYMLDIIVWLSGNDSGHSQIYVKATYSQNAVTVHHITN